MVSHSDALQRLALAELAEERAWGSTDGKNATPQAEQIAMRISLGEFMLVKEPDNQAILEGLEALRERLERVKRDPRDREYCRIWRAAFSEWQISVDEVLMSIHLEEGK